MYLHCISNGDTAVLHYAINIFLFIEWLTFQMDHFFAQKGKNVAIILMH